MQKTLTIKGKTFTPKQVERLIDNDKVLLNSVSFDVTYRIDEHNMFENTKRQDSAAKFMFLWGRGYKAAFVLPLSDPGRLAGIPHSLCLGTEKETAT